MVGGEVHAGAPQRVMADGGGCARTRITRDEMKIGFRSLSRVTEPHAPARTSGSFVIEPGHPTLDPA
ncbi:hypothetical protein ABGB18_14870 [Nonomuraea sp. B12E4]|uniref:hypothetical protein n=1 Tax=Nonomuraea sp. B12E4 TaxID=3153564 RepID=UPI00325CD4EA